MGTIPNGRTKVSNSEMGNSRGQVGAFEKLVSGVSPGVSRETLVEERCGLTTEKLAHSSCSRASLAFYVVVLSVHHKERKGANGASRRTHAEQ